MNKDDKPTNEEAVRLVALACAAISAIGNGGYPSAEIVRRAEEFEIYIRGGK